MCRLRSFSFRKLAVHLSHSETLSGAHQSFSCWIWFSATELTNSSLSSLSLPETVLTPLVIILMLNIWAGIFDSLLQQLVQLGNKLLKLYVASLCFFPDSLPSVQGYLWICQPISIRGLQALNYLFISKWLVTSTSIQWLWFDLASKSVQWIHVWIHLSGSRLAFFISLWYQVTLLWEYFAT